MAIPKQSPFYSLSKQSSEADSTPIISLLNLFQSFSVHHISLTISSQPLFQKIVGEGTLRDSPEISQEINGQAPVSPEKFLGNRLGLA